MTFRAVGWGCGGGGVEKGKAGIKVAQLTKQAEAF